MNTITCSRCGFEYDSLYDIRDSTDFMMIGVKNTCPRCGQEKKEVDGIYNFDSNGVATLLTGPEFTPDVLLQLAKLVKETRAAPEKADHFVAAANTIAPSLGDKLDAYLGGKKNIAVALGLLFALINTLLAGYKQFSPAAPTTVTNNYYVLQPKVQKDINKHITRLGPPAVRGTNLTLPKKKRRKK